MSNDYAKALGAKLRAVRNQQGLSLQGVEAKSHGAWKAVVVGSYERGDRAVTVQRLAELAEFYGVPMAELLPEPASTAISEPPAAAGHRPRAPRPGAGGQGRTRWPATSRPSRPSAVTTTAASCPSARTTCAPWPCIYDEAPGAAGRAARRAGACSTPTPGASSTEPRGSPPGGVGRHG